MSQLCLFEDRTVEYFYPLCETRHIAQLLVGGKLLCDRAQDGFPDFSINLKGRTHISPNSSDFRDDENVLLLNGRLLISEAIGDRLPEGSGWVVRSGEEIVAASVNGGEVNKYFDDKGFPRPSRFDELRTEEMFGIVLYGSLWSLLDDNGPRIAEDALGYPGTEEFPEGVLGVHEAQIYIATGATVSPGVVLDATDGPIVIESGVRVMPGSVILGPAFIGRNSTIKVGAKIYGETSIGEWSKVGGEVENSIILGYSNKQHDGFLGHSYLGSWVNLGADTNTSDLKNNYGTISIDIPGHPGLDTGRMMLGTLMGDHSKTGINTMLNTGTVVGVFANIFGGGFPPKSIPSFFWGGAESEDRYDFEKACIVAERVMSRRNISFSEEDRELLHHLYTTSE